MVLRSLMCVGSMVLLVGCATNSPAPTTAKAEAPTFRDPSSIRPDAAAYKPVTPAPVAVAKASPATAARVQGEWTPPVAPRNWRYIVIHHSASPTGSAAAFDREHRVNNGWDELGYHFVIDNGRGGPDGQVEVGPRWLKQKWGAHAKTSNNLYNDFGVGICFVGDFMTGKPTSKQMASASRLVAWLMQTYDIPADHVIGHRDTKQTLCPGRNLNLASVRSMAAKTIADAAGGKGIATPTLPHVAAARPTGELMQSVR